MIPDLELGPQMNQSELIEKVAQATELNQAAVGQAMKAVVNAILDALVAGEAVRVAGLGSFDVAARPAVRGGIHKPERPSKSQPARQCGSTQARPSRMHSIRRPRRQLPERMLHHQRNPRCGSKRPLDVRERRDRSKCIGHSSQREVGHWARALSSVRPSDIGST